jgi:prepilin-type N-terminal cleavage/methylation domain-containing protein
MRYKTAQKGFTLMETLIYIALFSILMSGAMIAAYNLLEGGGRNTSAINTQEEGTFINRKINWALTGARTVTASPDGTTLTITRPDLGAQSPLVIVGDGTSMTIARGTGGLAVVLNAERYPIGNPATGKIFAIQPGAGGKPPSITVSFLIGDKPFIFRTYVRE